MCKIEDNYPSMEIKGKTLPPDPLPTPDEINNSEKVMVEARIFESVSEKFHG
jgi:hypothetical protein